MEVVQQPHSYFIDFNVKIEADIVKEEMDKVWKKIKKDIELPGFRKGNVSREVAETHFGMHKLYGQIVDVLFNRAIDENYIKILYVHKYGILGELKRGEGLTVYAVAERFPDVKLITINELNVEAKDHVSVDDDDIEAQFQRFLIQSTEQVEFTDREIKEGDLVEIDYVGTIDREEFEGGSAKGFKFVTGQSHFIGGFDKVAGNKPGDTIKTQTQFPDDYRKKELRGKEAVFEIKINKAFDNVKPELNDELFASHDCKNEDEFRNKYIKNIALEEKKNNYESNLRAEVIKQFVERADVEFIPMSFLRREIDINWRNHLYATSTSVDDLVGKHINNMRKSIIYELRDDLHDSLMDAFYDFNYSSEVAKQLIDSAPKNLQDNLVKRKAVERFKQHHYGIFKDNIDFTVRTRVVMIAYANLFNITVTDEDFNKAVEDRLDFVPENEVEKFREQMMSERDNPNIKEKILVEKCVDDLVEKVNEKLNGEKNIG